MKNLKVLTVFACLFIASGFNAAYGSSGDLLNTIAALKSHINGSATLTGTQIMLYQGQLANLKSFMDESTTTVNACLDLIDTFETTANFGPMFIETGNFDREESANAESFDWTMYKFMQYAFDEIYTLSNLSLYETELDGFVYRSSTSFPGVIKPGAVVVSHTATINASYPDTLGWLRQGDELPARKPTGTYLLPGTIATITVPQALVNKGYQVRVGAHSWDFEEKNRRWIKRFDRCTKLYDINATTIKVANPLGGGIYFEVPYLADGGVVTVGIDNVIRSPYFSSNTTTGHITTVQDWQNTERNFKTPWADFQTEKYMTQVPTSWIYSLDDPAAAIGNWDKGIDVMNDLMGFPRVRGKETVYTQADVIMRSTVYAPGYPAVNVKEDSPSSDRGGDTGSYLVYGPNYQEGSAKTEIHEQGHAYFFDKFAGETESAVNLHYVAIMNQAFGFDLDYSLAASRGTQDNPHQTLNNTAIEWMTSFNFSPREVEMHTAEKAYQLKGHAKFVDIAKLFGWEVINDYYKQLVLENTSASSDDDRILRMSREAGVDLRPLFHFWGIHPSDPTSLKSAIESEGLVPSSDIYARLMEYKSILPDGNAAFRTYCLNWWGRKPSEDGKWTESEHARQWDTTELWEGEDDVQQRPDITEAEMYTEAVAADIRDYVQDIIDMYFPDGPPHFHGELGNDIASWTGQTVPVTATVTNNTDSTLNYTWSIEPQTGAAFSANGDQASVTITKPAGDPASYKLSFTVDDGGTNPSVIDVVIITVYDDACQATRLGLGQQNKYDIHPDCEVNIADIAAMLSSWLEDNRLKTPIIKQ